MRSGLSYGIYLACRVTGRAAPAFLRDLVAERYAAVFRRLSIGTRGRLYTSAMPDSPFDPNSRLLVLFQACGIRHILLLAEPAEIRKFSRSDIIGAYRDRGMTVAKLPLPGRALVSADEIDLGALQQSTHQLVARLSEGTDCVIHCRAGTRRSVVLAACVVAQFEQASFRDALEWVEHRQPAELPDREAWLGRLAPFYPETGRSGLSPTGPR
ncbi:MAG: hypothetical protein LJE84_11225 [Gammaproteobacteria bacterium]|nr:hypothetical protein [Gammaproteobacteria bacterium]